MQTLAPGVFLPDGEIFLYLDSFHPVQRHHIELPDRAVILRRVSGGGDQPALGKPLIAEGLALQELEHHRGQGLS